LLLLFRGRIGDVAQGFPSGALGGLQSMFASSCPSSATTAQTILLVEVKSGVLVFVSM
jgi:hypothetical protein